MTLQLTVYLSRCDCAPIVQCVRASGHLDHRQTGRTHLDAPHDEREWAKPCDVLLRAGPEKKPAVFLSSRLSGHLWYQLAKGGEGQRREATAQKAQVWRYNPGPGVGCRSVGRERRAAASSARSRSTGHPNPYPSPKHLQSFHCALSVTKRQRSHPAQSARQCATSHRSCETSLAAPLGGGGSMKLPD
eukprot:scaffold92667_cov58-Phaeocystis_antarctica.AAC.5